MNLFQPRPAIKPLVLLLLVTCLISGSEASFRLCGFRLTTTLQAICRNQVCGGYQDAAEPAEPEADAPPKANYYYQILQPRKRDGIATACCHRRCSLSYLRTYCCTGADYTYHLA